jgi:mycothiol synthase
MERSFHVTSATPREQEAAIRLLFQDSDERDRDGRVNNALHLLARGDLDADGLIVAREGGSLVGAMVSLPVPGASALVWPPQVQPGVIEAVALEDALLVHATAWLRQRGARLAQSLLSPDEIHLGASLVRNGFTHVTGLWYLRHDLDLPIGLLLAEERLRWHTYANTPEQVFHGVLERTYQETLDCPEVNGVRSIDEVIAGHKAQGDPGAARWWLASEADQPVGVLLLAETPESRTWELAYLGVVPEARRRGLGREMVRRALFETRAAEAGPLAVAVDARNHPARQLYASLGFEPFDRREVFLAVWR